MKISVFVICVEAIVCLLSCNLHDCAFKVYCDFSRKLHASCVKPLSFSNKIGEVDLIRLKVLLAIKFWKLSICVSISIAYLFKGCLFFFLSLLLFVAFIVLFRCHKN